MTEDGRGPRPLSHRARQPWRGTLRRLLPPLGAVSAVIVVIVLLLFLNGRSSSTGGPALSEPPSTSVSASTAPASSFPTASASGSTPTATASVSAPPVSEPPATTQPAVAKIPVTVLNNSRRNGLGQAVAAQLRARGWPIAKVGNFRGRVAETTVYYASGQLDAARELAREFSQIRRIRPRFEGLPGQGLTLVVTRDWQ